MKHGKHWLIVGGLAVKLMMVLALSLYSVAYAQEARWEELDSQAGALYDQGKYHEAISVAKEALKVAEQNFGPKHLNVARSLNELAFLYTEQGRYAEAESLYKQALAIQEKALGPNHPDVAKTLNKLAELYHIQGQETVAEPLYKRAQAIWRIQNWKYPTYFAHIRKRVELNWSYPEEAAKAGTTGDLLLQITVMRDGQLKEISLIRSSGSQMLDENAIRAVKAASPFNPFPRRISKQRLKINLEFSYLPSKSTIR
jgi:TonB family protein